MTISLDNLNMPQVSIYTTPTCVYCKMAKEFFKNNKIDYQEIDVATDPAKAQEMSDKSGQLGVPVIIVEKNGQENVVIGFVEKKLRKLLDLK